MIAEGYRLDGAPEAMQMKRIHRNLAQTYWAKQIPFDLAAKAIRNSICVGAFFGDEQVGFTRVISDRATFAYLVDVYVEEEHRRNGLASAMVRWLMAHDELQGLRRWLLYTADMQPVYASLGWQAVPDGSKLMEIAIADIYVRQQAQERGA